MEFDDVTSTESDKPAVAVKREKLPWVLLGVVVALSIGTSALWIYQASAETKRANDAYVEKSKAQADADRANKHLEGEQQKVKELEAQLKELLTQRDTAVAELKALQEKAAKAQAKKAPDKPVKKKRR